MSESGYEEAKAHIEQIVAMVAAYEMDWVEYGVELIDLETTSRGYENQDEAREAIEQYHYGVQVRSHWVDLGEPVERDGLAEFRITLAGGGPAVQIMGEFDHKGGVKRCSLQYQDWGTPWTDFIVTGSDYQAMLTFCSMLLPQ